MALEFNFQLPPRTEALGVYSTLKCTTDRVVHRDRQQVRKYR